VLAPSSLQEAVELVQEAFDLADYYRQPVLVLGDGLIGQIMEVVDLGTYQPKRKLPPKDWATTGCDGSRRRNIVNSLYLDPDTLEAHDFRLQEKYERIARDELRFEEVGTAERSSVLLVAYGTVARVVKTAQKQLAAEGIATSLVRPITLFPFPSEAIRRAAAKASAVLTVELSTGQMVDDVRAAVQGARPVHFFGRAGGSLVSPDEVAEQVRRIAAGGRPQQWPALAAAPEPAEVRAHG